MRLAVSKSTCAPSTAASGWPAARGIGTLELLAQDAGNDGRMPAKAGVVGVPPGIL